MTARGALLAVVALVAGLAGAAGAAVPEARKVAEAVADANREAGRGQPLLFDVTLRIGDGGPVATGVLAAHPTGLARLELRSTQGFVERHLLQGSEYSAARDGTLLRDPRPFLPPVFLLQASSGAALRAALASFGVDGSRVMWGMSGEHDCYVLGGRTLGLPETAPPDRPSFWVDSDSLEVVRIDRHDGVRFRFGPPGKFERVRAPSWISIEAPGQAPARLEVMRVAPADAPAAAFGSDWLLAPPQ